MRWVLVAAVCAAFGYGINAWVVSHALVVDMNGKYQIAAEGWAAVWWIMAVGAVPSLILGMMTSEKIGAAIARLFDGLNQKERVAMIADRKKLEAEKNRIFQDITSAAADGRQVGVKKAEMADKLRYDERHAAAALLNAAEVKLKAAEGKIAALTFNLRAARQRSARLAKRDFL